MPAKIRPDHAASALLITDEKDVDQSRSPIDIRTAAFLTTSAIVLLAALSSLSAQESDEDETAFVVAEFSLN